jgi:Tfp pilus assembly PilM family ATPase/Tfp pilus assembly protein PilN
MNNSRLIALEWDQAEARLVLASRRGRQLRVEAAERVELPTEGEVGDALRERVRGVLDRHRVGKGECLLAVGRSAVEMKHLALPPVPDEELPELARFQAQREFTTMGEDWPLDFLPTDDDPNQPRHVLAAALDPQTVANLRAVCEDLGLEARSIVLRPCGMASLVARRFALEDDEAYLLIDPLDEQVDLAVLHGRSILMLRCARADWSARDEAARRDALLEVRRTMAAAANRLHGKRIAAIYLCGAGESQQAWAARLHQEFDVPVHPFDPFADAATDSETVGGAPDERARYASLLGMLLDAADDQRPALDFLNPRQKPPAASNRRQVALLVAAALACVLLGAGWFWQRTSALDDEIATLKERANSLKELADRSKELREKIAEIDQWAASDINWLGELNRLSAKLPPAEAVMLTQLRASGRAEGGEITLEGRVEDSETIGRLAASLRDPRHAVSHELGRQNDDGGRYGWVFKSTVQVTPAPEAPPRALSTPKDAKTTKSEE